MTDLNIFTDENILHHRQCRLFVPHGTIVQIDESKFKNGKSKIQASTQGCTF
jgi:hypothetical protein